MTVTAVVSERSGSLARRAGFTADVSAMARRAVRLAWRDPEAVVPPLIVGVFFFVVDVGAFERVTRNFAGLDVKAFQLPVAIVLAITGLSRAQTIVTDIRDGYFDRLLMTPIRRPALLLGFMVADLALVTALSVPVLVLGFAVGVRFASGPLGILVFLALTCAWGLAFTGFPYAIALKTGNAAAVNSSFLVFFPFLFLTTTFLPREALTGWMSTVAGYNPVTYLLAGMRSLILTGWDVTALSEAFAAVAAVAVLSQTLSLLALRGRVRQR